MSHDLIRRSPKVLLHDHLDGGLRPSTIVELAAEVGHRLPTTDPDDLAAWFLQGGDDSDLVTLPRGASSTPSRVLQTPEAIERVAASAWRTWPPTASSTPSCGTHPSCPPPAG
jgi:adenosine deaminase